MSKSRFGLAGCRFVALALMSVLTVVLFTDVTHAGPEGWNIRNGNVRIKDLGNGRWRIWASNGSIINYRSFDINSDEFVRFLQPNGSSRVLNRISGDFGRTDIDGTLKSNGIVYFVNPAGVFFGNGALVDVGGIYAAAGTISDQTFISASIAGNPISSFENLQGSVVTEAGAEIRGDQVHLIGQRVRNRGTIKASHGGVVTMLAGDSVTIQELTGRVRVHIDGEELATDMRGSGHGGPGATVDGVGVLNTGTVRAQGGQMVLGAGDMFSLAIKNKGVLDARGGEMQLAARGGQVEHNGDIRAHDVYMSGDEIVLKKDIKAENVLFNDAVTVGRDLRIRGEAGDAESVKFASSLNSERGEINDLRIDSEMTEFEDGIGTTRRLGLEVHGKSRIIGDIYTHGLELRDTAFLSGGPLAADQVVNDPDFILLMIGGFHKLDAGSLTFQAPSGIFSYGNISTANGDLIFDNALTFIGDFWDQYAIATGGDLVIRDGVTKRNRNLTLGGNRIFLAGDALASNGNIRFNGDTFFDSPNGTNQQARAINGQLRFLGDVERTNTGNLTLRADDNINLHGDAFSQNGNLWFRGNTRFNAVVNQSVDANGGRLDFDGFVRKPFAGNLTLHGDDGIFVGGIARALDGNLIFENNTTFDGVGDQTASATGVLDFDGDAKKTTAGNLRLIGPGNIEIAGDAATSNGDLRVLGNVFFNGVGNQEMDALGGNLDFAGNAFKSSNGSLTLHGDDGIFAAGNVTVLNGNLTFENNTFFDGTGAQGANASGGLLDFDANLEKTTNGLLTLHGDNGILVGRNAQTSNGDLIFENDAEFGGAGIQAATANGGKLVFDGNAIKASDGNLILTGDNDIFVGGDAQTLGGNLVFRNDTFFDGGGGQAASAAGGRLDFDGDAEKTTGGNLTLHGDTGIFVFGDARTNSGNLKFENDTTFDGTGNQVADASGGRLDFDGSVLKSTNGSLELIGDNGIRLGGNAETSNGDLLFRNDMEFDGGGSQFATANGGKLDFDGNVAKFTPGNVTLKGDDGIFMGGGFNFVMGDFIFEDDVFFDGATFQQVIALDDLDFNGNARKTTNGELLIFGIGDNFFAGDVSTSNGNLFVLGDTFFDGGPAQRADANGGGLFFFDDVAKTTGGDLNLFGDAGIFLDEDISTSNGNLTFESDTEFTGNLTQRVDADGGVFHAMGTLTKTDSGNLNLHGDVNIDLDGDVDVQDGSLIVEDDFHAAGNMTASQDINLWGNGTLDGVGTQKIDALNGTMHAFGSLRKTTEGDVRLAGGSGVFADGTIRVDGGGLVVEDDMTFSGGLVQTRDDQRYQGAFNLGADARLISLSDGMIRFYDTVDGPFNLRTMSGGVTRFDEEVGGNSPLDVLRIDGESVIAHDINTFGGIDFRDNVRLIGNSIWNDTGLNSVSAAGTIDGSYNLTVRTPGVATFGGDIGGASRLNRFSLEVLGVTTFDGATMIRTFKDVKFNDGVALAQVPRVATIGANNDFMVHSIDGRFVMGDEQKFSVLGDLDIDMPSGGAFLGDLNTLGNMTVTSDRIRLLGRPAGVVIGADGSDGVDQGVDYVAGGKFFFSTAPILMHGTNAQFANPEADGDALGTLGNFLMRLWGDLGPGDIRPSSGPVAGTFLDLRAQGPTDGNLAESLAGAIPSDEETKEVTQGLTPGATIRRRLETDLRIPPRLLRRDELIQYADGRGLFLDNPMVSIDTDQQHRVVVNRILRSQVVAALNTYDQIVTPDRSIDQFKNELGSAWQAYVGAGGGGADPAGFRDHLATSGEDRLAGDLDRLREILDRMGIFGLTRRELSEPTQQFVDSFRPAAVDSTDTMQSIIYGAAASETASVGDAEPVAMFFNEMGR